MKTAFILIFSLFISSAFAGILPLLQAGPASPHSTSSSGFLLLSDGASFLLYSDGTSRICFANGC